MKKIILLFIATSVIITVQGQDIINSTGSGGSFLIKNSDDNLRFKVENNDGATFHYINSGGYFQTKIGSGTTATYLKFSELYPSNDYSSFMINNADSIVPTFESFPYFLIVKSGGHALKASFVSAFNGAEGPDLFLKHMRGSINTPASLLDGDFLGSIFAEGRGTQASISTGAVIQFKVNGTVGTNLPTDILFKTQQSSDAADIDTRMTIKSNGTVNIATLDIDADAYVKVDVDGNLYSTTTSPSPSLNNEIKKLKEENAALEAEMADLRKILEMLMDEK